VGIIWRGGVKTQPHRRICPYGQKRQPISKLKKNTKTGPEEKKKHKGTGKRLSTMRNRRKKLRPTYPDKLKKRHSNGKQGCVWEKKMGSEKKKLTPKSKKKKKKRTHTITVLTKVAPGEPLTVKSMQRHESKRKKKTSKVEGAA